MAFSNSFDTTSPGSAALNREDLHDALSILAPSETPVLSTASKFKVNATFFEWGVDKLASPVTTGVAEGADVVDFDDKFENVARLRLRTRGVGPSERASHLHVELRVSPRRP